MTREEAINEIRSWNFLNGKEKEAIQTLVPELRESEEQPKQKKNCNDCPHCVDRKDQFGWHFKGCFGGPYNGKFIAEIDECPLQQEQKLEVKDPFDDGQFRRGYESGYADAKREQKPVEWSEDDEDMLWDISSILCQSKSIKVHEMIYWLKSLRPQSHWKPSEKHLSALLAIFNDPNNIGSQTCQLALTDLYEQLKKLM